jgi:NitT/TauT family transport system substrate-binding protein
VTGAGITFIDPGGLPRYADRNIDPPSSAPDRRRIVEDIETMDRFDELFDSFAAGRISRRRLVQGAAALGVSGAALQALSHGNILLAQPEENRIRWVSPRGRLEVFDDYGYWVAKRYGYFGDVETVIEGGPAAGAERLVAENQADMAYPSPGLFTSNLEAEVPIVSVFEMGAYDVFDIAFRKGEATDDLKTLEGKTIVIGDASWQAIVDPMLQAAGADPSKVEYAIAGVTAWGQALQQGQGDAALAWAGLRAQWRSEGLDFEYWLGKENSKFPANSYVIRQSDFENESTHEIYEKYLRGWAMGLEFGHHNPRAAAQITNEVEQLRATLDQSFPGEKKADAVASMWELADVYRGDWPTREGWGWHDLKAWNLYFDTAREIGLLTREFATEDVVKNDFIAAANDFDHEQVKADAEAFELSEEYAAIPEPEGAGAEGAYPI